VEVDPALRKSLLALRQVLRVGRARLAVHRVLLPARESTEAQLSMTGLKALGRGLDLE